MHGGSVWRQGRGSWPIGEEFGNQGSTDKERMPLATRARNVMRPLGSEVEIIRRDLHAESLVMGQPESKDALVPERDILPQPCLE